MGLAQDLVQALGPEAFGQGFHPFMVTLERMRPLVLLPWAFLALGLFPLGLLEAEGAVRPGLGRLGLAFLLALLGSLYARFPLGPRVQGLWVLALGLLAFQAAYEASLLMVGLSLGLPWAGLLAGLALLLAYRLGTGQEAPLLPAWMGVGDREDLRRLAGALEGLAFRRGLFLLYLYLPTGGEGFEAFLRQGDLAFRLGEDRYLLVLQRPEPQAVQGLIRRLKERFPGLAYAVERWRRGTLAEVLGRLEAEALLQQGSV